MVDSKYCDRYDVECLAETLEDEETKEERETLNKTRKILAEIGASDSDGFVYDSCDNDESEIWWIERFLAKLINMSEIE
jgi:hypothetical protein